MTKAELRQAQMLRRVVERIDRGEVAAPGWYRERLVGAMLVLDDPQRPGDGVALGAAAAEGAIAGGQEKP